MVRETIELMVVLLNFLRLQMIMIIPSHLGMVILVYQFKLNVAYIKNIKFVDAYIMLSKKIIYFQYEIGVL